MPMDINSIMQAVGSVGFPIVMCVYMITTLNKTVEANTKATEKLVTLANMLLKLKEERESDAA